MNKEREKREFDLLLWKSGELDPREETLIKNNLSDEDIVFISMLESQESLFENVNSTNVNLVVKADQNRSANQFKKPRRGKYFPMTSFIASLTALLIVMMFVVSEKPETSIDKPSVVKMKSVESVKPGVAKSTPLQVKTKKPVQSKYRKRYLSLKNRRGRMARLNLFSRPKNST